MISRNLNKVKNVITDSHRLIVVSAPGKRYDGDKKVTDLLYQLHNSGYQEKVFSQIANRYKTSVVEHAIHIDIDTLLAKVYQDIKSKNDLNTTVSKGEELSARIMASYLNATYLEADEVVRFNNNGCDVRATLINIRNAVNNSGLYVMGGFYGAMSDGRRCLFDRGGSDISGALGARALNATVYENWTDVDGLCVANPRLVSNVKSVKCVSYRDMYVLAYNGAEVLHPNSIKPVQRVNIPIHIRNIYNPYSTGTLVSNQSGYDNVIGVTAKVCREGWRTVVVYKDCLEYLVTSVLQKLNKMGINVCSVTAQDNYASFVTKENVLKEICSALLLTN